MNHTETSLPEQTGRYHAFAESKTISLLWVRGLGQHASVGKASTESPFFGETIMKTSVREQQCQHAGGGSLR